MTAGVVADYAKAFLERGELRVPHPVGRTQRIRQHHNGSVRSTGDDGVDVDRAHLTVSNTAAKPWPPPMHMVSRTMRALRRRAS